jgi:ABC-type glycerol-3-phosphate transport system permease component
MIISFRPDSFDCSYQPYYSVISYKKSNQRKKSSRFFFQECIKQTKITFGKTHIYMEYFLFYSLFRLFLFILDSFSSSANTRSNVRTWWWCQSFCFQNLPMLFFIYYHNLICLLPLSLALLNSCLLCMCVHFSALSSSFSSFFSFAWHHPFE